MATSGVTRLSALLVLSCVSGAAAATDMIQSGSNADAVVQRGKVLGSIAELNRVTFYPNIRDPAGPEQWVVFFCVDWYPHCQALREAYLDFASAYERKHNVDALFRLKVRFAEVKCAVDKVLCNEQEVQSYPTVTFYRAGQQAATWSSGMTKDKKEIEKLAKFLEQEVGAASSLQPTVEEEEPSVGFTDLWSLPMAQQHPLQTALRVAPYVAAAVGMIAMIGNQCAELAEGVRQLSSQTSDKDLQKTPVAPEDSGLRSRLPESWAQRPSIEL